MAITFEGPNGELQAALAMRADAQRGAVLIIHENQGLNDHTRTVAGRLATAGYVATRSTRCPKRAGPRRSPRRRPPPQPSATPA